MSGADWQTVVEDVIADALYLISVPERWCQHMLACDANGTEQTTTSPYACRWCAWGALDAATWRAATGIYAPAIRDEAAEYVLIAASELGSWVGTSLGDWNDRSAHAVVVAAFERALAGVRART